MKNSFSQNDAAEIDVLWVVDNSESMADEQESIGLSFQSFINTLIASGVNYHIGVVSTDVGDGGVLNMGPNSTPVITPDTADATQVFLENVRVGVTGSRIEKGFATAALVVGKGNSWKPGRALKMPNPDFIRPEASLFIIMVSDEDDKSFGPVGYYRRLFESYKGAGNEARVSVSGIVVPDLTSCKSGIGVGTRYIDLAAQTGGIISSICDDFSDSLRKLSISAAGLRSAFELSSKANPDALVRNCTYSDGASVNDAFCVRVNGVTQSRISYAYDTDRNAVVFVGTAIPPAKADITIEYIERRLQ